MRDFLGFLLILAIVFFAVGETRGWYLGVPSQTPIFVYKKDHVAETTRRTLMRDDMPVRFRGEVRRGTVTLEVWHERPASFQTNQAASPNTRLFEQTFREGDAIAVDRLFEAGGGVYRIVMRYADATGVFRLEVPGGQEL